MINYVYWVRGQEFLELAKLSIASVQKLGACKVFIYTDDDSLTEPSLIHLPPGRPAMVANLDAQVNALCNLPQGERVLFLDADTLVKKPFPFTDADLFVTYRTGIYDDNHIFVDGGIARDQPYNYGVIGAIVNERTIEAFIWLRSRILKMTRQHQAWYGNQIALFDLLGRPADENSIASAKTATIRWALDDRGTDLSVVCLTCELCNYTPGPFPGAEDLREVVVLHFKGKCKELMQAYA